MKRLLFVMLVKDSQQRCDLISILRDEEVKRELENPANGI